MENLKIKSATSSLVLAVSLGLTACGGGGSSSDSGGGTPTAVLSGTAAAGAPLIGTVTVKGALGNTKSAFIEADGDYNVDVTGLTAPYRLRAQGTVGGRTYKLHSYAVESDIGGNVNITPFTDLIVANAAQQIAESFFDSAVNTSLDDAEVEAQEAALQAKLQSVFTAVGVSSAINLLNSTFSADHSELDAALDLVRVEVDSGTNIATITNILEPGNTITDDVTDATDNTATLTVTDPTVLTNGATDTQQIAAIFNALTTAYTSGLPTLASITDYFSTDFYNDDYNKSLFLTDITTDPDTIGLTFSGITVSNLDSGAGTAEVTFSFGTNGVLEYEPETWFAAKNGSGQWQLRGDQRIVDAYFNFHCNDYDGSGAYAGACGINTQFWDEDFTNNTTGGLEIKSGTVEIIDGTTSAVKATVYLGTPSGGTAGDVQVYDESDGQFYADWKGFGTGTGEIDVSVFSAGDTIQYKAYTADLDISTQSTPLVVGSPVATYTDPLLFDPEITDTKYPTATSAAITAINNFTLGSNLTVAWTLAEGTRNQEVLVEISDASGNRLEIWDWNFGSTATSKTYSSSLLDSTAAGTAGLDTNATEYNLKVRIYAEDELTGQAHSRDYDATIPGPAATGGGGSSSLTCGYESGWNDTADGGLGAPISPNSFAEFESVLGDCGTAQPFTASAIAGNTYNESPELTTFDSLTGGQLGTEANPGTGQYNDTAGEVIDFEWWVEAATCTGCTHNYVVLFSDSTIDVDLPSNFEFRETSAVTGLSGSTYTFYIYSEQTNFGDMVTDTGSDGEIWTTTRTQQ